MAQPWGNLLYLLTWRRLNKDDRSERGTSRCSSNTRCHEHRQREAHGDTEEDQQRLTELTYEAPEHRVRLQTTAKAAPTLRLGCNTRSRKRSTLFLPSRVSPKPQSESTADHRENAADCILIHTKPAADTYTNRHKHTHTDYILSCSSLLIPGIGYTVKSHQLGISVFWCRAKKKPGSLTSSPGGEVEAADPRTPQHK